MAKQPQYFFLEEWLQSISVVRSKKNGSLHSSTSSAQAIIQAWADLRDSLQCQAFHAHHLQALKILVGSQATLHVADPQAKLVISILSSPSLSLPHESYPLFFRLLYVWVRKSRQTSLVVESAIEVLLHIFSRKSSFPERSSLFFSEGVLLLGALSFRTSASEKSKRLCFELLCSLLEEEYRSIFSSDELASSALAGVGYALSSSVTVISRTSLGILFRIWGREGGPSGISQGLMLLHLIEWVLSNAVNLLSLDIIDVLSDVLENVEPTHSSFALIMTAAGVVRAINRSGSSGFLHLKNSAEDCLEIVARELVSATESLDFIEKQPRVNHLLHFIALALARTGGLSYRPSILGALALALLIEVFPLQRIYDKILKCPQENWGKLVDEINDHLSSLIFKEAGAITAVFCNQYAYADEDSRSSVENQIWDYCQAVYLWHRQTILMLIGRGDLISDIEKIAESAFLMIVVFSLEVTKHLSDRKMDGETNLQISVKILVSFSCMEYFRRMRLPEYMDTIKAVILCIQNNDSASVAFLESMPSYHHLITNHASPNQPKAEHPWSSDEVQTARIVFYMRVIPTCIDRLPASVFKKTVAPVMFLYMGHPNVKVASSTHSVFAAFVTSGKDLNEDERTLLKEQLVFYYLERSLEGYPGITPFEGMASGVAAVVRHLPAGSPSIFYCISSLVQKSRSLCSKVDNLDDDLWRNWEGELEAPKKVLDLLLRLLSLVDIQVLPHLMKLLAQLIVELPLNGQNVLLNEMYQQIAESDDVIRKPALVSWVQSLSYLSSHRNRNAISSNGISARL